MMLILAISGLVGMLSAQSPSAPAPQQEDARKAKARPSPAPAQIRDDPALPRALLIGDSISMGYTPPTGKLLAGKVNLHRIGENGGPTTRGLENLDKWLGKGKWDVIHFNWGLHDLKYMDAKGQLGDPKSGKQQVPMEQYEKNLETLVKRLKATGARLIWATTTPVPKGSGGRVEGDEKRYNAVAARIMQKYGVTVNDLHALVLPKLNEYQLPANVHFRPAGSQAMAEQVARTILEALKQPAPAKE
jgi:acyl-CoA thioesterase-1